jgi:hypothetical protein
MPFFRKRRISGWKNHKFWLDIPSIYLAFANPVQADIKLIGPHLDWKSGLEDDAMLPFGQMERTPSVVKTASCHHQLSLRIPQSKTDISLLDNPPRNDGELKAADLSRYAAM